MEKNNKLIKCGTTEKLEQLTIICKLLVPAVYVYGIILASFFEYGFWTQIETNPLSSISFSELATSSVAKIFPIFFIGCIISYLLYLVVEETSKSEIILIAVSSLVLLIIFVILAYFNNSAVVLCLLSWATIFVLISGGFFEKIPKKNITFSLTLFLLTAPIICWAMGESYSRDILYSKSYAYIPEEYIPESMKKISDGKGLKYIGKIGKRIVLSSVYDCSSGKDNCHLIFEQEKNISPIVLEKHKETK